MSNALLFVGGQMNEQILFNVIGGDCFIYRHFQFHCFRINIADINTALVMEQYCVSVTVWIDTYVSFFILFHWEFPNFSKKIQINAFNEDKLWQITSLCGMNGSMIKDRNLPTALPIFWSLPMRALTHSLTSAKFLFTAINPSFPLRLINWSGFTTNDYSLYSTPQQWYGKHQEIKVSEKKNNNNKW